MGAVNFSLDKRLVDALQSILPLRVLVETGTFEGQSLANLQDTFEALHSVELSHQYYQSAVMRFAGIHHIYLYQGDSATVLRQLIPRLGSESILYFLDAHWCVAINAVGQTSQCPLLEELQAIGKLNEQSVVLIDDARLFLATPLAPHEASHWPSFHDVVSILFSMSSEHELMVVNDVIAYFPKHAHSVMKSYAQSCGTDWLLASNCLKENATVMQQLVEKEAVIQEKEAVIQEKEAVIQEKEAVIQTLSRALRAHQLAYRYWSPLRYVGYPLHRMSEIIRPRLGNLNQYQARPLGLRPNDQISLHACPRISIVTPSYKQGDYIERTIQSVFEQTYPNLQYFVQDGGSIDGTVDVLKRYEEKLSGWASEKDSGQSQAINLGFTHTDGEIMAWLNSDDLLLPGALHTVADYFNRNPDVDVVYGNRLLIDQNDMEIGRWILPGHDSDVLSWADYIPQETLFWRRRIWEKVGGKIDESFLFAMDWDLLVRFREAGAKFGHIPQFLGAFRIHNHQKTSAAINEIGRLEMDRIRERILGRIPQHKEIRKAVLPYLVKHIVVDMVFRVKSRLGWRV
ncbi:MAG: glycosyltransferase [Burkholderiales bacterium]|nr:glycosyltransferase [Burkholderiales bacterium]